MANMKHKIFHTLCNGIIAYLSMVSVFTLLMLGIQFIPQKQINRHIYTATKLIEHEGIYKQVGVNIPLLQLDNFTDCYMMNIIASSELCHPLESAVMNYYYMDEVHLEERNLAYQTECVVRGNRQGLSRQSYARYWHGYQTTLRPMLYFMDYSTIRIVNYLLFTLLVLWCLWLIKKRINIAVALIFAISLLLFGFLIVPLSLQFSTCFYISLISIILLMLVPRFTRDTESLFISFLVIGGITSYMDFLTTPQLTLGLPMTIYLLASKRNDKIRLVMFISIAWLAGYASIWASKWLIAYLLTQHQVMEEVKEAVAYRSSNYVFGKYMTLPNILASISHLILKHHFLGKFLVLMSMLVVLLLFYVKSIFSKKVFINNLYLLLIAMIIPIWFLVLRNHSLFHYWFTWRAWIVVSFNILVFIYNTSSWAQLCVYINNVKSKFYAG